LIPTGDRSGLQTRIGATESVSLSTYNPIAARRLITTILNVRFDPPLSPRKIPWMKARMPSSYAAALNSQSASLALPATKPFATFSVDNRSLS
jgi:hypothetical protein